MTAPKPPLAKCEICFQLPCICEISDDDYEYGEPTEGEYQDYLDAVKENLRK